MIVIGGIMAVPVHCPGKIFLEPVRMAMLGDHPGMILKRLEDGRRMVHGGHDRPKQKREANKSGKRSVVAYLERPRHSGQPVSLPLRCVHRTILLYPPWGVNFLL